MLKKLKNNRGFLFIEVLMAFSIVCTVILLVTTILSTLYTYEKKITMEIEQYILLDDFVIRGESSAKYFYNKDNRLGINHENVKLEIIQK